MSIHVALEHVSTYTYDRLVQLGPQLVRLRPAPHCRTRILAYSLQISPAKHFINWQQDPQANFQAHLVIPDRTREFRVQVSLVGEMAVLNPFDFFLEPEAEAFPFRYSPALAHELAPFLVAQTPTPKLAAFLANVDRTPRATIDFLVDLNRRVQHAINYLIRIEPGVQTPEETLTLGAGSCRDSSWLLVQMLRHLGVAARFVSGYLIQLVPDVKPLTGPQGPLSDFTDLHAWCEVFLPGAGWIGLDPTSGLLAGEGHLPLACAPEPVSAAAITGEVDACEVIFTHEMRVSRIWEAPRVTLPYTDHQWQQIDALGREIDGVLERHDVRLTQGGEPTFVAANDHDGAEWNTDALGPTKRARASAVLDRLRTHYAAHGLVHHGQGKWYPGEPLPRWSLNLFWRRDGEPVWREPGLLIGDELARDASAPQAETFLNALVLRLGCGPEFVFPAYEDAWHYLWREHRLPANADPFDSRLDDPLERARLALIFGRGVGAIVGYVLPLARDVDGWRSGSWCLRDARCLLVPGDSPLGLRLPLDSIRWVAPGATPEVLDLDPLRPLGSLPAHAVLRARAREREPRESSSAVHASRAVDASAWIPRTALCAEARAGRLHIFMPPLSAVEDYLELIACIEATAAALGCPVAIEGYEPPRDPRLQNLRLTPDPGVIEVNVQPVDSWPMLVEQAEFLYAAAHETQLASEKFMLDGRHTGTGGGNHFVLGAATPTDSPFLRRPDLLASMVTYWHNHPSLSYLFSGMFLGPTSQAPRADEARHEAIYELEITLLELQRLQPTTGDEVAPWTVDRLFRNLLVDVTGNTHRAEFCIDKLYSPDGVAGRLGLLELRAFEMPPHPRMSLAQQLLMRALVARFWQQPYRPLRLQRWGTALHDRFMLPHFVWDDFSDVLAELGQIGFRFDPAWFAPHFEFRFPRLGDFAAQNIEVEIRAALEPWHVLGEENTAGGTARYVDSSLERLQVKVTGMVDGRHLLTCNGRALPLQTTGTGGEYVAGVRYRAWQPPACLHPTIGVHSPLTFDLVDGWAERSIGGCQYHVMHPGGRNYETLPVNSQEAEARRLARFFRQGHTPGTMRPKPVSRSSDYPFTLDMRGS